MVTCPECGNTVDPSYVYCPFCYPQFSGYRKPVGEAKEVKKEEKKRKGILLVEKEKRVKISSIRELYSLTFTILKKNLIVILPLIPLFATFMIFYSLIFNMMLSQDFLSLIMLDLPLFISSLIGSSYLYLIVSSVALSFSYSFFPVFVLQYASEKRINIIQTFLGVGKRLIPSFITGVIVFIIPSFVMLLGSIIITYLVPEGAILLSLFILLIIVLFVYTTLIFAVPITFFENMDVKPSIKASKNFFFKNFFKSVALTWPFFILCLITFFIPMLNLIAFSLLLLSICVLYFHMPGEVEKNKKP